MNPGLVILGASYAGVQLAASAREAGYAEPITLLGDEDCLPYQRPPLSKGYLTGNVPEAALVMRSEEFYRDNSIQLRLGARAIEIDTIERNVVTADGRAHAFSRLAFTTGCRSRRLPIPGADLAGVLMLRSLDDARRLRDALVGVERAVVVGGGYIGLEVASAMIARGVRVTVLEGAERLLSRTASVPLSTFLARAHCARGVEMILGTSARALHGEAGRVRAVECTNGALRPADLVIVGIGAVPNTELARAAGLACEAGAIRVDACARADETVVAAGDCASVVTGAGLALRFESIQNATDQAKAAGATVAGQTRPLHAVPWFWSDQFDLKIQSAGLIAGYDRCVMRGDPNSERFGLFYFRDDRLIAVDTINRPADHMVARKLLAAQDTITPTEAMDESVDLRAVLTRLNATNQSPKSKLY